MTTSSLLTPRDRETPSRTLGASAAERVRELRARIRELEPASLGARMLPTHPSLGALLPGGGLQQGAIYSVDRSAMLVTTLLAHPSTAGTWCAVVGMPEFGAEAAAKAGVALERLVLIPRPGDHWLQVASALADVIGLIVLHPFGHTSDAMISRLQARLRERGTTLLVVADWPFSEAKLTLSQSAWSGIGEGYGYLASREATVTVTHRATGRPRSARLRWPDAASTTSPAAVASGTDVPLTLERVAG